MRPNCDADADEAGTSGGCNPACAASETATTLKGMERALTGSPAGCAPLTVAILLQEPAIRSDRRQSLVVRTIALEPHSERHPHRERRRIAETVERGPELRTVVPVHAADRRFREWVEGGIPRGGRAWRQHGGVDALQVHAAGVRGAAGAEDGAAARAQLELVEHVQQ